MKLEESGSLTSDYTTKTTVIKTVWYWNKNINRYHWNRIEISEINTQTYGQLIYDKEGTNIQWRKGNLFNKECWKNWTTTCKRMKLEHSQTPYTETNSQCIKDPNIRPHSIKFL